MDDKKTYTFTKKELNIEKNKVISKFASVASHDLKNVVGGLSNISYYLSKVIKPENDTQKKMLDMLASEVVTLNKRISEALDMTRVKQLNKSICDLENIVSKAINEEKVDGITFQAQLCSANVKVDPDRMKQVFSNIIKNAKDSMNNSGTINIFMKNDSNRIITTISDSGKGMSTDVLESCFDPMFSTKLAKAVGMGLTVALQIVEMHNGSIDISSQIDKGTSVIINLPIIQQ